MTEADTAGMVFSNLARGAAAMSAASTSSIDAIVETDSGAVDHLVVGPGLLLCELAGPCCPRFPDLLESLLGDVEAPEFRVVADKVSVIAFCMSLTLSLIHI